MAEALRSGGRNFNPPDLIVDVNMTDQSEDSEVDLELAGCEYHGSAGATQNCIRAVQRLLHFERISRALVLTSVRNSMSRHALMLEDDIGDQIFVKSGFTSGYLGQGPSGFSFVLILLDWCRIELDETFVASDLLDRLDLSALTIRDVATVSLAAKVRPMQLYEYILDRDYRRHDDKNPWRHEVPVLPLPLFDDRLTDLVHLFRSDPDAALLKAHRRIESIVRKRADILPEDAAKGSARVYSRAFGGDQPILLWTDISDSERIGRLNLFTGVASAFRNSRAHSENHSPYEECVREFLLVNQLYRLEREAVPARTHFAGDAKSVRGTATINE